MTHLLAKAVQFLLDLRVRERRVTHLLAKAVQFLLDLRVRERRVPHLLVKAVQFLLDLRFRERRVTHLLAKAVQFLLDVPQKTARDVLVHHLLKVLMRHQHIEDLLSIVSEDTDVKISPQTTFVHHLQLIMISLFAHYAWRKQYNLLQ